MHDIPETELNYEDQERLEEGFKHQEDSGAVAIDLQSDEKPLFARNESPRLPKLSTEPKSCTSENAETEHVSSNYAKKPPKVPKQSKELKKMTKKLKQEIQKHENSKHYVLKFLAIQTKIQKFASTFDLDKMLKTTKSETQKRKTKNGKINYLTELREKRRK